MVTLVLAFAAIGILLPGALETQQRLTNNPPSYRADQIVTRTVPTGVLFDDVIVVRSDRYTVGDPAFASFLGRWRARVAADVSRTGKEQVSRDRHAVLLPVQVAPPEADSAKKLIDVVRQADRDPSFSAAMTGKWTVDHDFLQLSQTDLKHGEAATDPLAVREVRQLRDRYIPEAFANTKADVLVGGETSRDIDYFDTMDYWLPIVFAFVLGFSFVLLTVAFRSIVVAAKAIVLNLLSVGAAYGLLVLVFEKGVGNGLLGFRQVDSVVAWVPLFLFCVLFGLSMDYHVFLLSRIRERFVRTGDNDDAVAWGVGTTARLITGAALIIIVVFVGFSTGDLVMFQQMGFGVAVALLLDATIVRTVLVPSAMKLLGRRNWYLPSWLQWLPELEVEHHEPG